MHISNGLVNNKLDKYNSIPDFSKFLSRCQTNFKWAPEIYQDEINIIRERQKGIKLDNK